MPEENILKQTLWHFWVYVRFFWTYLISEGIDFLIDLLCRYTSFMYFFGIDIYLLCAFEFVLIKFDIYVKANGISIALWCCMWFLKLLAVNISDSCLTLKSAKQHSFLLLPAKSLWDKYYVLKKGEKYFSLWIL